MQAIFRKFVIFHELYFLYKTQKLLPSAIEASPGHNPEIAMIAEKYELRGHIIEPLRVV